MPSEPRKPTLTGMMNYVKSFGMFSVPKKLDVLDCPTILS